MTSPTLINSNAFSLVEAEAPDPEQATGTSGTITYTAKNAGSIGNDIVRTWNWRGIAGGEMFPPGITVTGEGTAGLTANLIGGAGVPSMHTIVEAMGDDEYDFIGLPYTDPATLDAMQEEMNDVTGRWAWSRQIYGHVFTAKMGTPQELHDFGVTRNDPHATVMGFAPSPTVSWRHAAALTAQAASSLRIDPARPLQTLALVGVQPPQRGSRFKLADNNTLLYSGIATEMESGGAVAISRCITTYRVNVWNQPDPSWLDVQTPATLAYIIRFLRQRILQKFGRHKLANDGTPFGFGQAIVTPNIIRAELIAAYSELMTMAIVENMDAFKAYLIVERDQNDPNRVNVLLPPDLINQLRIFAMLVEFRLQYTGRRGLTLREEHSHGLQTRSWRRLYLRRRPAISAAWQPYRLDRHYRADRHRRYGRRARLHRDAARALYRGRLLRHRRALAARAPSDVRCHRHGRAGERQGLCPAQCVDLDGARVQGGRGPSHGPLRGHGGRRNAGGGLSMVKLTQAIQAHGAETTELEFRKPTGGDVAACGFPFSFTVTDEGGTTIQPNAPAITAMIARLGNIPLSSAKSLAFDDWMACMGELFSFFGQSIPAGLSSGVSTSLGSGNGTLGSPSA